MMRLLFVCTGNTCRSAIAEALAKHLLSDSGINCTVESRGIYADGSRISENAFIVLNHKYGLDASGHISKRLKKEDLESFDLILTMTSSHKYNIFDNYKGFNDKVLTLKEYTENKDLDISDPYGLSLKVYEQCAAEIESCLEKLIRIMEV